MQPSWKLPEEVEKPFRDGLAHAAKRRVAELHGMLERLSAEQLAGIVTLSCYVTAYTAIDVDDRKWPNDAQVRQMAQGTVKGESGGKPYEDVFADISSNPSGSFAAALFITVNVLTTFTPKNKTMWEFLDLIEAAHEGAWLLDLNLLPALMVRALLPRTEQIPSGEA